MHSQCRHFVYTSDVCILVALSSLLLSTLDHDRAQECADAAQTDDEEEDGNGNGIVTGKEERVEDRGGIKKRLDKERCDMERVEDENTLTGTSWPP